MAYSPTAHICGPQLSKEQFEERVRQMWDSLSTAQRPVYSAVKSDRSELFKHATRATEQLKHGETIGRRGTLVVSFWDMRPKWEKWGDAWETEGTDGDAFWENLQRFIVPAILKLVYFKMKDGKVCQLAYVLVEEKYPSSLEDRARYNEARAAVPKRIE